MHRTLFPALVALALTSAGCLVGFVDQAKLRYSASGQCAEVRLPVERRGEPPGARYLAGDGDLSFEWRVEDRRLRLTLENRSGETVELPAEGARFRRDDGEDLALVLSTKRLVQRAPPAIRAGGSLELFLVPEQHLRRAPGAADEWWAVEALFEEAEAIGEVQGQAKRRGQALIGRWFELVLPVVIGENEAEYRFRFSVDGFRIVRRTWA